MFDKIKFIEEKKHGCYSIKIDKNSYEKLAIKELLSSKTGDFEDRYYNPFFNKFKFIKIISFKKVIYYFLKTLFLIL